MALRLLLLLVLVTLAFAEPPTATTGIGSACNSDKDCGESLYCSEYRFQCDLLDNVILEEQQKKQEKLEQEAQTLTEQRQQGSGKELEEPQEVAAAVDSTTIAIKRPQTSPSPGLNCIAYEEECKMANDIPLGKPCCVGLYCMAKPGALLQVGLGGEITSISSNTYREDPAGILISEGTGICRTKSVLGNDVEDLEKEELRTTEGPANSTTSKGKGVGPLRRALLKIALRLGSFGRFGGEEDTVKIEEINCTNQIKIITSAGFSKYESDQDTSAATAVAPGLITGVVVGLASLIKSLM